MGRSWYYSSKGIVEGMMPPGFISDKTACFLLNDSFVFSFEVIKARLVAGGMGRIRYYSSKGIVEGTQPPGIPFL